MKKVKVFILMAFLIAGGLFAQTGEQFFGDWTRTGDGFDYEGNPVIIIISIADIGWFMRDTSHPGGDNPPNKYTISGNTIAFRNADGSNFGTGTIDRLTLSMRYTNGRTAIYNKWETSAPPAPRVVRREFTTAGNHTFTFNEGFPATIEIYALGAGGGGQGGHSKDYQSGISTRTERGRGAGGGGGSATYAKMSVNSSVTLNVTVGAGGTGGARHNKGVGGSWESGRPGTAGADTIVRVVPTVMTRTGSTTITAQGGRGGAVSGAQNVAGGVGGVAGSAPSGILDWIINNGGNGENGRHNSEEGGFGGNAGRLQNQGSEASFGGTNTGPGGGARGGHGNNVGFNGGDGRVLIIVKY